MMIPSNTKAIEEQAVALILKECNNIHHSNDCSNNEYLSYVEWDKEGYVIALVDLGLKCDDNSKRRQQQQHQYDDDDDTPHYWDMPPFIGHLSRLTKLTVYYCNSLPREICNLCDTLKELAFHFSDELVSHKLPIEVGYLTNLIDFRIHSGDNYEEQSPRRILPIPIMNLPNLRYIYYRGQKPTMIMGGNMDTNNYNYNNCCDLADDLQSNSIQFKESLEILEIEYGNLTEKTVSKILSYDFLIEYPKLSWIVLPNNNIKSLTSILERTQPPSRLQSQSQQTGNINTNRTDLVKQALPLTIRLRCLNLLGNPVLSIQGGGDHRQGQDNDTKTIDDLRQHNQCDVDSQNNQQQQQQQRQQDRERSNLLQFLSLHEEITSLGHGITESPLCTTEILLALDLNDGGRVLLSKGRFNNPIPLSVWPVVLERINIRQGYYSNTNIIYHLLRNGPVLGINQNQKQQKQDGASFYSSPPSVSLLKSNRKNNKAIIMTPTSTTTTTTTTKFDTVVVTPSSSSSAIGASSSSCRGQQPGKQQHLSSYHNNNINSATHTTTTSSPTAIMSMEATTTKKRKVEALSQDETVDISNGALLLRTNGPVLGINQK